MEYSNAGSVNSSRNATPKEQMSNKSGPSQGGLRFVHSDSAISNGGDKQEERKEKFTGRSTLPNSFG